MDDNGIEAVVVDVVSRITKTPKEKLTRDTDLRVELNVDSLQGLQIVAALEKIYGIEVGEDEIDMYDNIDLIVTSIERNLANRRAEPGR